MYTASFDAFVSVFMSDIFGAFFTQSSRNQAFNAVETCTQFEPFLQTMNSDQFRSCSLDTNDIANSYIIKFAVYLCNKQGHALMNNMTKSQCFINPEPLMRAEETCYNSVGNFLSEGDPTKKCDIFAALLDCVVSSARDTCGSAYGVFYSVGYGLYIDTQLERFSCPNSPDGQSEAAPTFEEDFQYGA